MTKIKPITIKQHLIILYVLSGRGQIMAPHYFILAITNVLIFILPLAHIYRRFPLALLATIFPASIKFSKPYFLKCAPEIRIS